MSDDQEKPARILFRAAGPGEPGHLNACIGWVQDRPVDQGQYKASGAHGMHGYVEGYRRAACALFQHAESGDDSPEYLVFPLAFLWRHHLELALKDIIATGAQLEGKAWSFAEDEHHPLGALWKKAASIFVLRLFGPDGAAAPEVRSAEAKIVEFAAVDSKSFGFRYATHKVKPQGGEKGKKQDATGATKPTSLGLPSLPPDLRWANLAVLDREMRELADMLATVRLALGEMSKAAMANRIAEGENEPDRTA